MKTGLTKKQKTTSIFFTDADDMIEVCTRNTPLKNRLAAFAEEYPSECRLIDDDENGCQTYEIRKGRFGFKLTPPYSQERKQAASRLAKNNIEELDFLDFIRDADSTVYNGTWSVYFVKRNFSSDLMGMKDIRTGKITFDEGVVYEMSDDKFIFNNMENQNSQKNRNK